MEVKRQQAYKFKLKSSGFRQQKMLKYAGCRRFVFNKALALRIPYYRRFKKSISYGKLCERLVKWKAIHPFLTQAPSQVLQQSLKDLDQAFVSFFKGIAEFPQFKKKS